MKTLILIKLAALLYILSFASLQANTLSLKGSQRLSWLSIPLYDARLYTSGQQALFSGPVVLELQYHTSFRGADIADRSVKEMIRAGADPDFAEAYRSQMIRIFPDVKPGTVLSASYTPGSGLSFYRASGKFIGRIDDDDFARYFLSIWLEAHNRGGQLKKPRVL